MEDEVVQTGAVQDAPSTPAVVEQTPEVAETVGFQQDDGELVVQEKEPTVIDDTPEEPETPAEPRGEETPLAPKSQNRFQQLANENRELKERIERLQLQESQLASEQELLNEVNPETGDYYTPAEVERIAFQKSRQTQAENISRQRIELEVQQNQQVIASEATRALEEFPIFNERSPEFNAELTAQADALLSQSLAYDDRGQIVGSNISPYQLYKTIYDSNRANEAKFRADAQRSTEKMLSNADVTPSGQRSESKFENLSTEEMAARLRAKGHDI